MARSRVYNRSENQGYYHITLLHSPFNFHFLCASIKTLVCLFMKGLEQPKPTETSSLLSSSSSSGTSASTPSSLVTQMASRVGPHMSSRTKFIACLSFVVILMMWALSSSRGDNSFDGGGAIEGSSYLAVGSDRDSHGCIGSAGYRWCEGLNSCVRPWEVKDFATLC